MSILNPAAFLAVAALAAPWSAQDDAAAATETIEAIKVDYEKAQAAYSAAMREARANKVSADEMRKIRGQRPDSAAFAERALPIVNADSAGEDGRTAAMWIAFELRAGAEAGRRSLEVLADHHGEFDGLQEVVPALYRNPIEEATTLVGLIATNAESDEHKAQAHYYMGAHLMYKAGIIGRITEESAPMWEQRYGAGGVAHLQDQDPKALEAKAIEAFQHVIDTEALAQIDSGRGTYGDRASKDLFELQNLTIGKVAPDIEGEDIDGNAFKLSDYRGKVVMLDFWGDW